jgi:parvulin-like peptidyl-prolyl isomerase
VKGDPVRTIISVALAIVCTALVSATARAADEADPVLAIVGDAQIKQSDVDKLYEQVGATPEEVPVERAIEELIRRESIRQYVLAQDVQIDQAAIDESWQNVLDNLKQAGLTLETYAEQMKMTEAEIKEVHTIDQKLRKIVESKVTEDELKQIGDYVRASHILLSLDKDASDEQVQQATAKIEFIKQEIENGESFEDAAKAYSDCPSSKQGGDLGYFFRYGQMVEPFAAAAYAQQKGVVGDPVRTEFGLHLIKVTDRRPATDEEKAEAHDLLLQYKFGQLMEEITKTVKVERLYKDKPEKEGEPAEGNDDSSTTGEE